MLLREITGEAMRKAAPEPAAWDTLRVMGRILIVEDERDLNDLIARQKTYLASARDRVTAEAAWEQARGTGVLP